MTRNNKYRLFGDEPNNPYYQAMKNAGLFDIPKRDNRPFTIVPGGNFTTDNKQANYPNYYTFNLWQGISLPKGSVNLNSSNLGTPFYSTERPLYQSNNPYSFATNTGNGKSSSSNTGESKNTTSLEDNDNGNDKRDLFYNISQFLNKGYSTFKNAPLFASISDYLRKKQNTPDYSNIENAKNFAMQESNIARANPNHISGNLRYNQYDYLPIANQISSQAVSAQNLASRQGRGNMNMLMSHINNLLANTSQGIGKAALEGWKANEAQRMAIAQENRRADEFNATADNSAEQAYINNLNAQRAADKQLGYNALSNYAQQKYNMQQQYNRELDQKRDEMVTNLGRFGQNAFDAVTANSNMANDYWRDNFGQLHHKEGATGNRWNGEDLSATNNYKDMYDTIYNSLDDNAKAEFDKMSDLEKKNYILNLIKNNNNGQTIVG